MATILVADDMPINRQLLVTLLGYIGHKVIEASDGAEALSKAKDAHPDLVITDIIMPIMDGIEFVRQMRQVPALVNIPIIFYTASFLELEARKIAKDCGITHVLTKPTAAKDILSTVCVALGEQEREAQSYRITTDLEQELLRDRMDQMSQQFVATNSRLSSVIDMTRHLLLERDPRHLAQTSCHLIRRVVDAQYAAVGILDERDKTLMYFCTSTIGGESADEEMEAPAAYQGVLAKVLSEHESIHWSVLQKQYESLNLPLHHPKIHSFLAVPIFSAKDTYGWIYVLNKTAGSTFTIDDERLLLSVGLKLAIFMENAMLWQQLQVHIAELKRSNDDLKQFAYVCSHDLQEPLRTISNYTQLLAKRYKGVLNDDADQFIDFIVDGAKRMQQQIEDLLLYSRVDRKGESFAHADCGEIVAAAIANLSLSIEETRAEIQVGQLPALFCDKSQIQQLIQNLLSNAMKFRSEQTPVVKINSADAGSNWTFTVEDNGIGFDMKHADRVFVIFKRLQTKDNYPGTGIGLAICKKIVERHGGRIWAESVPGNGSSFHFSIPKAAANE